MLLSVALVSPALMQSRLPKNSIRLPARIVGVPCALLPVLPIFLQIFFLADVDIWRTAWFFLAFRLTLLLALLTITRVALNCTVFRCSKSKTPCGGGSGYAN